MSFRMVRVALAVGPQAPLDELGDVRRNPERNAEGLAVVDPGEPDVAHPLAVAELAEVVDACARGKRGSLESQIPLHAHQVAGDERDVSPGSSEEPLDHVR